MITVDNELIKMENEGNLTVFNIFLKLHFISKVLYFSHF